MKPVHRAIAASPQLRLILLVTGLHFEPAFAAGLAEVREESIGELVELPLQSRGDTGAEMCGTVAECLDNIAANLERIAPDIVLLQGDRGEMLAGAIAAAHMNIPCVHMSGGDCTGTVDDSVRNAITKLAHFHLPNCAESARRLQSLGEDPARILIVGEPTLDAIAEMEFLPRETLEREFRIPGGTSWLMATLHPVTDEVEAAAQQMTILLEALREVGMPVIFTYPNRDAGGQAMLDVLMSWSDESFIHIAPTLGSERYLSCLRHAAAIVGNSSSGIFDASALRIPAVNIGSRQSGRTRAGNVIDVGFDRTEIAYAIRRVLSTAFRESLRQYVNPYGDGGAGKRTAEVLAQLDLRLELTSKWLRGSQPLVPPTFRGI